MSILVHGASSTMQRNDRFSSARRPRDSRGPGIITIYDIALGRVQKHAPFVPREIQCEMKLFTGLNRAYAAKSIGMFEWRRCWRNNDGLSVGSGDTLPEQLQRSRIRRGMTVGDLADRSGLDRRTIEAVESGSASSMASLMKVLAVLAPRAKPQSKSSKFVDSAGLAQQDSRFTPKPLFDELVEAFGEVDLEPKARSL